MQIKLYKNTTETILVHTQNIKGSITRTYQLKTPKKHITITLKDNIMVCDPYIEFPTNITKRQTLLKRLQESISVTSPTHNVNYKTDIINNFCVNTKINFLTPISNGQEAQILISYTLFSSNQYGNIYLLTYPKINNYAHSKTTNLGRYQLTTYDNYSVAIKAPSSLGKLHILSPKDFAVDNQKNYYKITTTYTQLQDYGLFALVGNSQIHKLSINLKAPNRSVLDRTRRVYINIPYDIPEYNQKVFLRKALLDDLTNPKIKTLTPKTRYLQLKAPLPQNIDFVITHNLPAPYSNPTQDLTKGTTNDIPPGVYAISLKGNDHLITPQVTQAATKLRANTIYQTVINTLNFVRDFLDYDEHFVKTPREAYSITQIFQTRKGVCMEYSRLTAALLLANKIPVRFAYGYLLLPSTLASSVSGEFGHQWIEVYFPKVGWVPVDPTLHEEISNVIAIPFAYLFLGNSENFIHLRCEGILNSCDNVDAKYTIKALTNFDAKQFVEITKLEKAAANSYSGGGAGREAPRSPQTLLYNTYTQILNNYRLVSIGMLALFTIIILIIWLQRIIKRNLPE